LPKVNSSSNDGVVEEWKSNLNGVKLQIAFCRVVLVCSIHTQIREAVRDCACVPALTVPSRKIVRFSTLKQLLGTQRQDVLDTTALPSMVYTVFFIRGVRIGTDWYFGTKLHHTS